MIAFLISLGITALVVGPLAKTLRKHAVVFYTVSFILSGLYIWAVFTGFNPGVWRPLFVIMQKGYLAVLFLGVVMFTGCFDEGTAFRKHFQPIRGELSILSFIYFLGHILTYLPGYLPRFASLFESKPNVAFSLIIAIILTVIFLALGVTSFKTIRKLMSAHAWKILQRFSYLMMVLLALHIGLVLGRSAFVGGVTLATVSFFAYEIILVVYAVLRIRKAMRDHKHAAELAASNSGKGNGVAGEAA